MIKINDTLFLHENELVETFIRASGPGGQNVNKVSSAVQLRFDVRNTKSLPPRVCSRLKTIAGSKLTKDGVIVITANRHRTQQANRQDAQNRLVEMIREATHMPKYRIPTRPGKGVKKRRLDAKTKRGGIKRLRSSKIVGDE
jgi:ribosome-associated protein